MISRENYKSVRIHIVTFKESLRSVNQHFETMNEDRRHKTDCNNKFICSVCLNPNRLTRDPEEERNLTKLSRRCNVCSEKPKAKVKCEDAFINTAKKPKHFKTGIKTKNIAVQTKEMDFNKNINLLNEVLTVFQNKKQNKQKSNTVILKDASISTEDVRYKLKPRLKISKVFQFSTDESVLDKNDKSTIITSHEDIVRSQHLIDLSKHKSSSIPQMKSEELKNASKEKTKSKDAIEEVNRMFGNVKRRQDISDNNRPLIRKGPRILPLVKMDKQKSVDKIWSPCKICKSGDLSSGDSFVRPDYCHHKDGENSDKCVYMMCCLKNCHKMPTGVMYCQCCRGENFRYRDRANFDCND